MTRIAGMTRRLRRYLAERLARLNARLADLASRLRATVAARVADNVAGVVKEAVEHALSAPPEPESRRMAYRPPARSWEDDEPPYGTPSSGYRGPRRSWDDPDDGDDPYGPTEREDLFGGYRPEPYADDGYEEEAEPAPQPVRPPNLLASPRLRVALATGLQAGAWVLRRRRGPGVLLAALAVGATAGVVALFGGPVLAAGAATLAPLLALAA